MRKMGGGGGGKRQSYRLTLWCSLEFGGDRPYKSDFADVPGLKVLNTCIKKIRDLTIWFHSYHLSVLLFFLPHVMLILAAVNLAVSANRTLMDLFSFCYKACPNLDKRSICGKSVCMCDRDRERERERERE